MEGFALVIMRRLIPLSLIVATLSGGAVLAQGAFPPVKPGQPASGASAFPAVRGSSASPAPQTSAFPPVSGSSSSAFPQVNGTQAALPQGTLPPQGQVGGPSEEGAVQQDCAKQALPLRNDAQARAKALQAASARHATAKEACKLMQAYSAAETRFLNFVTVKQTACGIPADVPKQMKESHAHTEATLKQVCAAANAPQVSAGPSLSDVLDSPSISEDSPRKKKGGSTFDTISGNVLSR